MDFQMMLAGYLSARGFRLSTLPSGAIVATHPLFRPVTLHLFVPERLK